MKPVNPRVANSILASGANFSKFFKRLRQTPFLESLAHLDRAITSEVPTIRLKDAGRLAG
jgi:hypothetical protein